MLETLKTKIVIFDDGLYFNGVKGKIVRKTSHFKDAKIISDSGLDERDLRFLENLRCKLVDVTYTLELNNTVGGI